MRELTQRRGWPKLTSDDVGFFKSTEQTGTGAEQDVAHGLGRTPSLVIVQATKIAAEGDTIAEGTHDATNCKVTAATGAKYKVIAF